MLKSKSSFGCMHSMVTCFVSSRTKLLVSELSHIFGHMDASVVMNMDASLNSLMDACMVDRVVSSRGVG